MDLKDLAERVVWTFVVTFVGALSMSPFTDLSSLEVAAISGVTAAVNVVAVYARARLSFLPSPGEGVLLRKPEPGERLLKRT